MPNNDLSILIKSILQMPDSQNINQVKAQIQSAMGKIAVDAKPIQLIDSKNVELDIKRINNALDTLKVGKDKVFANSKVIDEVNLLKNMQEQYKNGAISLKELSTQMGTVRTRAAQVAGEFRNVNKDGYNFVEMLTLSAKKIAIWGIATTAVYGGLRELKLGISYIYDLDNSLNEIRIVTGNTQAEVERLAVSYNKLAKEMSVSTRDLVGVSADLYRQGLNDTQVEERMKGIVQYAKISSISLNDSNRIITSTANATGESVQKIIDIFALLGDTTASGADEIGDALTRVASASENSNISLEKSASWIATISSITRESASTIGRSLNSVISRYESIKKTGFNEEDATKLNDVVRALSQVGINALDSKGQLLDFATVMDAVGAKFDNLSKNEQAYITTTMFGTYQRNRGITLLRNYNDSLKNYENALNAAGTAEQKFGIYQESSAAKLDKMKASLEGFWQNTIDSNTIKQTLDNLNILVEALDKFVNSSMGSFLIQAGLISVALKLIAGTSVAGRLINSLKLLALGTSTFRFELTALKASLMTFLPTAIFIGLGLLIELIIKAVSKSKELKENFEKSITTFNSSKENIKNLEDLSKQYDELNSKVIKTAEEKQKFIEVQNAIGESCKDLGVQYDAEGNAIIKNSGQIQKYIELKKQQLELDKKTISSAWENNNRQNQNKVIDIRKKITQAQRVYDQRIAEIEGGAWGVTAQDVEKASEDLSDLRKQLLEVTQAIDDQNLALLNSRDEFIELDDTIKNNLISSFNEFNKIKDIKFDDFIDQLNPERFTDFSNSVKQFQQDGDINKLSEAFDVLRSHLLTVFDGNEQLVNSFLKTQQPAEYTKVAILKLNSAMQAVASGSTDATNQMVRAFAFMGIEISKDVASVLSSYSKLILGIKDVVTAMSAFDKIATEQSRQAWLASGGDWADQRLFKEGWKSNNSGIKDALYSIGQMYNDLNSLSKGVSSPSVSSYSGGGESDDKAKRELEQKADSIIDTYKDIYNKQKEIVLEANEQLIKSEEERHNTTSDNLDSELDQYKEIIDAKLALIDKTESEAEYQKKLTQLQQERQDIQNRINTLSLDNSPENQARLEELRKDLADKTNEIDELQHDHSIDLQKDALNEQLNIYEKDIQLKKDAEDAKYEAEKARLEKIKEDTEKYYANLIDDEQRFSAIKSQIMAGNLSQARADLTSFAQFIQGLGDNIYSGLISKMSGLLGVSNPIGGSGGGSGSGTSGSGVTASHSLVQIGSRGSEVTTLQQYLNRLGYGLAEDGIFGQNTYNAVTDFQRKKGIGVDGIVGTQTWSTLANALGGSSAPSTSTSTGSSNYSLVRMGSSGSDVKTLQQKLNNFGGYGLVVDGIFGARTYNAVLDFQRRNALAIDGIVGSQTWGALSKYHEGGIVGTSPSRISQLANSIFNARANEQVIMALKDEILTTPSNIKNFLIPNLQNLMSSITPQISVAGSGGNRIVNFYIDKVITENKQSRDNFFDDIDRHMANTLGI